MTWGEFKLEWMNGLGEVAALATVVDFAEAIDQAQSAIANMIPVEAAPELVITATVSTLPSSTITGARDGIAPNDIAEVLAVHWIESGGSRLEKARVVQYGEFIANYMRTSDRLATVRGARLFVKARTAVTAVILVYRKVPTPYMTYVPSSGQYLMFSVDAANGNTVQARTSGYSLASIAAATTWTADDIVKEFVGGRAHIAMGSHFDSNVFPLESMRGGGRRMASGVTSRIYDNDVGTVEVPDLRLTVQFGSDIAYGATNDILILTSAATSGDLSEPSQTSMPSLGPKWHKAMSIYARALTKAKYKDQQGAATDMQAFNNAMSLMGIKLGASNDNS